MANVAPTDDVAFPKPIYWEAMTFRSKGELILARAFDELGVWFIPNARGRVGKGPSRRTRELDLLVNIDGCGPGSRSITALPIPLREPSKITTATACFDRMG